MQINTKIRALDKIEKPVVNFSEKYCKNIDLRTSIKSLPLIGGHLDNLFAYKGSKIIQDRVDLFFKETEHTLRQLSEEKIDKDFINSEEGFYIFQKIYEQIIRVKEKEKIQFLKNVYINSISIDNSKKYYKERFINLVADLSIIHIEILKYYCTRERVFEDEHRNPREKFTSLKAVEQSLNQLKLTESQIEIFCLDLLRYNLLSDAATRVYDAEKGRFRATTHAFEFLSFILLDEGL